MFDKYEYSVKTSSLFTSKQFHLLASIELIFTFLTLFKFVHFFLKNHYTPSSRSKNFLCLKLFYADEVGAKMHSYALF